MRKQTLVTALIVLMFALAVVLRVVSFPRQNIDTKGYLNWYSHFEQRGFAALADDFSVYTPPYLYLLWLASLVRETIDPRLALKLIPTAFDLLSAYAVYKLVRLKYPQGQTPWLAAAGFLLLPTVILNSAYWGQIDSFYTSFLLLCVYFLLTERPTPAMLMLGLSLAIKAQAVFLLPFLAVMFFKKRIPWPTLFLPPLVFVLSILPAVWAGRPFMEALTIYVSQSGEFQQVSMHAPNLYSFAVGHPTWRQPIYYGGLALTVILLGGWVFVYARRRFALTPRLVLLTALVSVILAPFLLPRMHDRYFYPADNLALVLAFFAPSYWHVALGYQVISSLTYALFLSRLTDAQNNLFLLAAILLNTSMVGYLVVRQWLETREA
ncbi:MAG: glycosyltransferase 87 family protein [Chloroflexota bacterium]